MRDMSAVRRAIETASQPEKRDFDAVRRAAGLTSLTAEQPRVSQTEYYGFGNKGNERLADRLDEQKLKTSNRGMSFTANTAKQSNGYTSATRGGRELSGQEVEQRDSNVRNLYAARDTELEEIKSGLNSGQVRLEAGQSDLERLESLYNVDSSAENAQTYNARLEQFEADLAEYQEYIDRYNKYVYDNSAEGIRERIETERPNVEAREALETERNELTMRRDAVEQGRALAADQGQIDSELAAIDERLAQIEEELVGYPLSRTDLTALSNSYYFAQNREAIEAMREQDAELGSQYDAAIEADEDMERLLAVEAEALDGGSVEANEDWQYLMDKYGLTQQALDNYLAGGADYRPQGDGYTNIRQLYDELAQRKEQAVDALAQAGYKYDRLSGYEKMLEDYERYIEQQEQWQQYAQEHPVLSTIDTIFASPFQGIDYLKVALSGFGTSDIDDLESYVPMNVYDMETTNFVSTVRAEVAKEIEENTNWNLFGQNVASFLYQTATSIADSTTQIYTLGSAAMWIMGMSAAANQAKSVIERGGTREQAFWGGLAAGAAEAIFESFSIESLLSEKSVTGIKSWLTETMKQAGVEASEEMFTEISNILTDAVIMSDRSEWAAAVAEYMDSGMTQDEAKKQAFLDCIGQVVEAGAGGFISGGVMGGATSAVSGINGKMVADVGKEFLAMGDEAEQAVIEEGLTTAAETQSHQLALELMEKQANGGTVTDFEIGRLYLENRNAVDAQAEKRESAETQAEMNWSMEAKTEKTSEAQSSERETVPYNVMSIDNPVRQQRQTGTQDAQKTAGYGEYGTRAFNELVQESGMSAEEARLVFESAYEAGLTNLPRERASLISLEQELAYNAGRQDAIMSMKESEIKGATVWGKDGGLIDNEYSGKLDAGIAGILQSIGKATGTKIIVEAVPAEMNANGYYRSSDGTIHLDVNTTEPIMTVVRHEVTHRMQELAPREYEQFRNWAVQSLSSGLEYGSLTPVEAMQRDYMERSGGNVSLSVEEAMDELAASFAEQILTDEKALREFVNDTVKSEDTRTMAQKFFDAVRDFIKKVKAIFKGDRAKMDAAAREEYGATIAQLEKAEQLWKQAYTAATRAVQNEKNAPRTRSDGVAAVKYSINESFASDIAQWDRNGRPAGELFVLGSTGSVLQGLGAIESDIYMNGDKLNAILRDHPEMSLSEIKRIPEILEDPVLILKSKGIGKRGTNSRMVLYGTIKAQNGKPVMAVLDLRPRENGFMLVDMQKVNSAYTKNNAASFVSSSDVLYADKKRTTTLLRQFGLTIASRRLLRSGYIGSITYDGNSVNMRGVPFDSVVAASDATDIRYSLKYDEKNNPYVVVEEDILAGVPRSEWVRTVKDNLRKKFPNGVTVGNNVIEINAQSRREMTFSKYMQRLMRTDRQLFADKLRATNNTDEILRAAQNWVNEALLHPRKDAIIDFARGEVRLRIGSNDYTAQVVVGSRSSENLLLYDILYLKPTKIQEKRTGTDYITKSQEGTGDRQSAPVSDNSISESGENVKAKFSLKGQSELMRENARLRETVEGLREQFKTTEFVRVDKKSLDRLTGQLLRDYSSSADINEISRALDGLYSYMMNGENNEAASWNEVYKRAYEISVDILESASAVNDELYREYKSLRDYLRTTGITLDAEYGGELSGYESLNDFRKANFGRIKLVNDGIGVDVAYAELANRYPELFSEGEYTHPADQLTHIAEVLDNLQPYEVNPYSYNMRESATWLASDIIERFYELPQAKPTFADRANRRLTEQAIKDAKKLERLREQKNARIADIIARNREKVKQVTQKERAKRTEAVKAVKEHYKAKEARASESRKARDLRGKIMRHANDLSQKLIRPSDRQHIPQELQGAVAKLLESINLESNYTYDAESGTYSKSDDGLPTKRTKAFAELRELYAKIVSEGTAAEYGMVIDPSLLGVIEEGIPSMLDKVIAMKDIRLADMSLSQLETVWDVLRAVEHTVATAGKVLSEAKYERTSEWATAFQEDTATRKPKRALTERHYTLDIETPYTFFYHYGDAGHDLYRTLRNAQDDMQVMKDELVERMEDVVSKEAKSGLEKTKQEFTTQRGDTVTLSKAHVMELYLLNKRPQAQGHLLRGGIVQPEIGRIRRGTETIFLTEEDLANITGTLTSEEKKIADGMQQLTLLLAEWGNKASMAVYGYEKFKDPNYWTIKSAPEGVEQTVEKGQQKARSIANMGSAKSVVPEASNTLDISGIFNTFDQHAADMLTYAAWLAPMEDTNRLFNFKFRDADGNLTGKNMKALLNRYGGEGSTGYWLKLMEDIQNGTRMPTDTAVEGMVTKTIGKVKKAAVAGNLRVVIQQGTAYMRAMAVLSPDSMIIGGLQGFTIKGAIDGWNEAKKYAPIAARKADGGYEIGANPKQLGDLLYRPESWIAKRKQNVKELPLKGAELMDAVTWGTLWNACKWQVKKRNKAIQKGSEAYYKAVKELFTEVIDQTQVVDGVLQRSQAMRSGSAFVKQMTAFSGEPTQSANMLIRAWDSVRRESNPQKRSKALKVLSRATAAYLINAVVNAFAQSLVDAWRDDDDEKGYWERVWKAFSGISGDEETWRDYARNIILAGNVVNNLNPTTWLPVWKDLLSLVQGFSVERMDAASWSDFFDSIAASMKSLNGGGKYTIGYAALKTILAGGKLLGSSGYNILRDVEGIVRSIQVETDDYVALYNTEKLITDPVNHTSTYIDILYRAYENDQEAYEFIYNDLVSSGVDPEKIASGMETRMKKSQGVTSVDDLEQRYLSPADQTEWDSKMAAIQKSDLWEAANEEQKDELEGKIYDLITGEGEDVEAEREYIAAGESYGIDETEYLLYKLALSIADQPNESGEYGSYTSAERAEAITSLNLSDEGIAYLWNTEQGYEALEAGIDMETYLEHIAAGDTVKVDNVIEAMQAGVDPADYMDFKAKLSDIKASNRSDEHPDGTLSKADVVDVLSSMNLSDDDIWYLYLQEYDGKGVQYAKDNGIAGGDYLDFLKELWDVDQPNKNGNYGTYTHDEIEAAIRRLSGLTNAEKTALFKSMDMDTKEIPIW